MNQMEITPLSLTLREPRASHSTNLSLLGITGRVFKEKLQDHNKITWLLRPVGTFRFLPITFRVAGSESQGVGVFWWSRSRIFYPNPEVQLNHFLHRTRKLGILIRTC